MNIDDVITAAQRTPRTVVELAGVDVELPVLVEDDDELPVPELDEDVEDDEDGRVLVLLDVKLVGVDRVVVVWATDVVVLVVLEMGPPGLLEEDEVELEPVTTDPMGVIWIVVVSVTWDPEMEVVKTMVVSGLLMVVLEVSWEVRERLESARRSGREVYRTARICGAFA